jgi:hypothetical protein
MMNVKLKIGLSSIVIAVIIICGWWVMNNQPKSAPIESVKEQDEISGLQDIIPEGWVLKRENDTITIKRIETCERDIYQKPNPESIGKENIHPTVTVVFEPRWNKDKISENEKCMEEWRRSPAAVSPPCRQIFANTRRYTIFVSGSSCQTENEEIIDNLKAYFESR